MEKNSILYGCSTAVHCYIDDVVAIKRNCVTLVKTEKVGARSRMVHGYVRSS